MRDKRTPKDVCGEAIKRLGLISRANYNDIGICKIWRNDAKSPVWITDWNQRRSSTMKEIEEMSLS